ncbi:hypothetical protein KAS55_14465 [Janthinobacterium lividum]|nr:hypothetical protein [Janthinobacterium lividum]
MRITGWMMPTHPFIRDIAHGFGGAIAYPGHEITVQFELRSALVQQEAPDVLRVFIVGVDGGMPGDEAPMPIEIHAVSLCFIFWLYSHAIEMPAPAFPSFNGRDDRSTP